MTLAEMGTAVLEVLTEDAQPVFRWRHHGAIGDATN